MRVGAAVYRVGPSGWSYPDWKGIVYPPAGAGKFDELAYISGLFDAVEVNVSFYRPVTPRMSASWVRRVSGRPAFRFVFKLHQSFTHDREDYAREAVDTFLSGLAPVSDASRLGCILMQFPWSFRRVPQSVDWIRRLRDDFGVHRLVVELRHDSWLVPETEADLRALDVGWCSIDQPRLRHCVGPTSPAIGPVGYVRFHGRRADKWFADSAQPFERYDYLYTAEELQEWLPRIRAIGERCPEVYVFCNNHYRGQGPANALQLRAMLSGEKVEVSERLLSCFPQLSEVRKTDARGFSDTLF